MWINGEEAARCQMGPEGMFLYSDQIAFNAASTVGDPVALDLGEAADLLVEGENVIAVQVANHALRSPLVFSGSLRVETGNTVFAKVSENFSEANGASTTHFNSGGIINNSGNGEPVPGGWLDLSPEVISGDQWEELEVRTISQAGGGEEGDGAISYTLSARGDLAEAVIPFPEVPMAPHWVTAE